MSESSMQHYRDQVVAVAVRQEKYSEPHQSLQGAWFVTDLRACVPIRIARRTDTTAGELFDYDPKCTSCWLGHAHSGDYHRENLAR